MIISVKGKVRYHNVTVADTFYKRFKGLMGVKHLNHDEGLWLKNCSSIHCFFMNIPIDVIYCNKAMQVVGIETVKPWHIGHIYKGTSHILEVAEGTAKGIVAVGDVLIFD